MATIKAGVIRQTDCGFGIGVYYLDYHPLFNCAGSGFLVFSVDFLWWSLYLDLRVR